MKRVAWIVAPSLVAVASTAAAAEPAPAQVAQPPAPSPTQPEPRGPVVDPGLIDAPLPPEAAPPPIDVPFLQYGVALTTELVASAGSLCDVPGAPCILGSGGGVVARIGRRSAGPWYFGGAYELSKQDPSSLYRFATLQQIRFEVRWYLPTGYVTSPYATFGGGVCGYGNEWSVDTYGPTVYAGIGFESQLSRETVVGMAIAYRLLRLSNFKDTIDDERPAAFAQIVGIDFVLEERDPLSGGRH
jgi:hypothetical protein